MKTEDAGKVLARITSAFPRPPMDPAQAGVWIEHLEPKVYETAQAACRIAEKSHRHRPSISEFLECYDEARHASGGKMLPRATCGACEDGWIVVRCSRCENCPEFPTTRQCPLTSTNTVVRCPNGCLPPSRDELNARALADEYQAVRERDRNREAAMDARIARQTTQTRLSYRDPSEPDRTEEPF